MAGDRDVELSKYMYIIPLFVTNLKNRYCKTSPCAGFVYIYDSVNERFVKEKIVLSRQSKGLGSHERLGQTCRTDWEWMSRFGQQLLYCALSFRSFRSLILAGAILAGFHTS